MSSFSSRLQRAIAEEEPRLLAISDSSAGASPQGDAWSKKRELGHLVDSATNNRARFIKAALEGQYAGPSYDGVGWVEMGGYGAMPWSDLIGLWKALNLALAVVLDRIPADRLSARPRSSSRLPCPWRKSEGGPSTRPSGWAAQSAPATGPGMPGPKACTEQVRIDT